MSALYMDYKLTPAAESELQMAMNEFRDKVILHAQLRQGCRGRYLDIEDIKRSKQTTMLSYHDRKVSLVNQRADKLLFGFSYVMAKFIVIFTILFVMTYPKYIQASYYMVITTALCNCILSLFISVRFATREQRETAQAIAANRIVEQWAIIEALSSRHIDRNSHVASVNTILEYLNNELKDEKRIEQIRAILKARNNIVHHNQVEERNTKDLIKIADEIIQYLSEKNTGQQLH